MTKDSFDLLGGRGDENRLPGLVEIFDKEDGSAFLIEGVSSLERSDRLVVVKSMINALLELFGIDEITQ